MGRSQATAVGGHSVERLEKLSSMADQINQDLTYSGITRIIPGWFRDLDSAKKPIMSSLVIVAVCGPLMVWAVICGRRASKSIRR